MNNNLPKEELKRKIRELVNKLLLDKGLKRNEIANYLGLEEKQYSSFYKYMKGAPFPKFLERSLEKIVEKLERLVNAPDALRLSRELFAGEENSSYTISSASALVWIPFDLRLPAADYNGITPPLSIIEMGKKKGIIAYKNTSRFESDGEIYIDTIGMATDIEPGIRISIKRINKEDWQTDRYYVIIDASDQISIRELIPGNNKITIRYISTGVPDGPHMELPFERIVAIFGIVDGTCIPRPRRNNITTPVAQP